MNISHKYIVFDPADSEQIFGLREIFIDEIYSPVRRLNDIKTIIDVGANIGLASRYFHLVFPNAKIYALEPCQESYELCQINLNPQWAKCLQVAAYGHESIAGMFQEKNSLRNHLNFRRKDFNVYTMNQICQHLAVHQIDLLKIDIEGAEESIFSGDMEWFKMVNNLVIEIHNEAAIKIIHKYIDKHFIYDKEIFALSKGKNFFYFNLAK